MTFTPRSALPFGSCLTALALVLTFSRVAQADECAVDADCGHGFSCVASGGQSSGSGGASASGGASGAAGVAGTGSGALPASGGTGGTGSGTGGSGAGTSGTGAGVPLPPPDYCGDGVCQDLSETVDTCPEDCTVTPSPLMCSPAACASGADCADGYVCVQQSQPGTGGVGITPYCGDYLCNGTEDAASCPADCGFKGQCQPQAGVCYTDSDCPTAYYCSFLGSSGTGTAGTSGTAGSTGSGGAAAGTSGMMAPAGAAAGVGGMATGGTASDAAPAGAPGVGGSGSIVAQQGTCMPLDGGTGGISGVGGGVASGGTGTGVGGTAGTSIGGSVGTSTGGSAGISSCPGGGCGVGGTSSGGTGSGVGGSSAGVGAGGAGTGGTTGGTGTGGSSTSGKGGTAAKSHDVVTHAGCSVSETSESSSFGGFALLGLALGWLSRRRRAA